MDEQSGPTPSLIRLLAVVDAIFEMVEEATTTSPGPAPRDVNDAFLGSAYGRAYRCLRSIRELTGRGEADDALILTRALLSIVGRSLYIVEPDDDEERENRRHSWRYTWALDAKRMLDHMDATGFEPIDDRELIARILEEEEARGTKPLPNDHDLLASLGLSAYYARVYRLASDTMHYSIGAAVRGFLEHPDARVGGGRIALKRPQADESEEALALATIVYGEFLERCEPVIRHGIAERAHEAFAAYWPERGVALTIPQEEPGEEPGE